MSKPRPNDKLVSFPMSLTYPMTVTVQIQATDDRSLEEAVTAMQHRGPHMSADAITATGQYRVRVVSFGRPPSCPVE